MEKLQIAPVLRWTALISLLVALALMFNLWEGLRGGYGWRWGYAVPQQVAEWLPTLAALLVYAAGCDWIMRRAERPLWQVMVWAGLGSAVLPFIFLLRWGDPLYVQFTRVASGGTSGPHLVAALYTPETVNDALRDWTAQQAQFAKNEITIHAALAPPGLSIVYYLSSQALETAAFIANPIGRELRPMQCHNLAMMRYSNAQLASAVVGMASPLWAALAIFPLLWLGRRLADEPTARWIVLLWVLVPGLALFTPTPNTVFPTLAVLCVALLWAGVERRAYSLIFGAGLTASVLTFLNFSVVPLLLLCGLLAFFPSSQTPFQRDLWKRTSREAVRVGVVFGLGLAVIWIGWAIYGGQPFWAMLDTAMSQHLDLERPYLPWLALHLWDYALFLGLPLMLLSLWSAWRGIQQLRQEKRLSSAAFLALALGLTLLILDFSGTARGETGRVWQFFFPFSLITAGAALRGLPVNNHRLLLGVQTFSALTLLLFIPVISTGLDQPPQLPPEVKEAGITVETNLLFDDTLRLTGFGGFLDKQNTLVVDLRWQADEWSEQPYYFSIIPVAPDGSAYREGFVYQPFAAAYPATCWQPGQTIIDRVHIPLAGDPPSGEWWLSLSVQDYRTYAPVAVRLPDGTRDQQAGIGPIWVE